jgi:hypothetical protein
LKAASRDGDTRRPGMVNMTSQMTDGNPPDHSTTMEGLKSMKQLIPGNEDAAERYWKARRFIDETNAVHELRVYVKRATETPDEDGTFKAEDKNAMPAVICSHLHSEPSLLHLQRNPSKSPPSKPAHRPTSSASSINYLCCFVFS